MSDPEFITPRDTDQSPPLKKDTELSIERLEREYAETKTLIKKLIIKAENASTVEELRTVVLGILRDIL